MNREGILNMVHIKMDEFTPPGVDLPFDDFIGPILDECAKEIAEVCPLHLLIPVPMVCYTTKRKIDTNIATLTFNSSHNFQLGSVVNISGITTHLEYNGTFTITAVTTDSISYALTHADETEATDTGGIVMFKTIFTDNKAYISKPSDFLRLYALRFPLWQRTVIETTKPDTDAGRNQDNPYLASGIGRPSVVIKTAMPTGGSMGEYLICGKVETSTIPSTALYIKIKAPEELPDSLIPALSYLAAAKVLAISKEFDLAKSAMDQYGLSLTQLAQS